jgi:hypothetical protein
MAVSSVILARWMSDREIGKPDIATLFPLASFIPAAPAVKSTAVATLRIWGNNRTIARARERQIAGISASATEQKKIATKQKKIKG